MEMQMNVWDDIVSQDVSEIFIGSLAETAPSGAVRPWPPVMIRDIFKATDKISKDVDSRVTVGYVADYLAENHTAIIAVYDENLGFLGIAVDEDVMALIKRHGIDALDYPIVEAVQRRRPVCSITDSPFVVLNLMRSEGWDRIGVSERGDIVGILHRRDLVKFTESGPQELHSHR